MFEEMADNDKARFQREKAEYNMNPNGRFKHSRFDLALSTGLISLTPLRRSKRDPNAPKRPLCGFMYFSAEERGKVSHFRDVFPYVENLIGRCLRCLSLRRKTHLLFAQVRQENPNFAVGQIGKELGRRWAEADPEVRN